jgi:hypothetical protein
MGLKKRLGEVRDDLRMVVRLISPSGLIESVVIAKKDIVVLHKYDGTESFFVPGLAKLEAYEGYKVLDARVKDY